MHSTIDGACGLHVLDSGAVDIAEGCRALVLGISDVDIQRVTLSVESACEGMGVGSHGDCDGLGDVGGQAHILVDVCTIVHLCSKIIPFGFGADVDDVFGCKGTTFFIYLFSFM